MLVVKKSQIPGAGKGLYTTKPIKKGDRIVEYTGEIITWKEYERRVELDMDGYLFYINDKVCIDAYNNPEAKARYANDAAGLVKVKGLTNNSEYEVINGKAYIVATFDIPGGSEIFVDYTPEYWDAIRHNLDLKKQEKEVSSKVKKSENKVSKNKQLKKGKKDKSVYGHLVNVV
jgi:SET domain-containing protein